MNKPKDEMVTRSLDVSLTATEVAAYSKTLSIEVENRNDLEREAKSVASKYKDSIDVKKKEINDLATKVRSERERRAVPCKWNFDFNANTKTLIRQDTFELVETRVIEPSERQAWLQLQDEAEAAQVAETGAENEYPETPEV